MASLATILDAFGAFEDDNRDTGWRAACPVHEAGRDNISSPSLILDLTDENRMLAFCQSQGCDFAEILAAVRLTPNDMRKVTYVGQSTKRKRAGKPAPAPAAARESADGDSFLAALYLDRELIARPDGPVAVRLRDEYGVDPAALNPDSAYSLGVGIDRDPLDEDYDPEAAMLTVTARTATGDVAFVQRRDPDPKAKVRWWSAPNPEGSRFDGVGLVGRRHRDGLVVVCEGSSDALTVAALDAYDVVAFRGAWAASEVLTLREALVDREVVVIPDADSAGAGAAGKVADRLAPVVKTLRVAVLPGGVKDVRDYFKVDPATFGERLAALIESAPEHADDSEVEFDPDKYIKGTDYDRATATLDFLRAKGHDLAYTDAHGYLHFDGTVWQPNSEAVVLVTQTQVGLRIRSIANAEVEAEAKRARDSNSTFRETPYIKSLFALATKFLTHQWAKAVVETLKAHPSVRRESGDFDSARDVIAVGNGVVNLRTGELRPMTSRDLLTKRLSIDYVPDAPAPQWQAFLDDVLVHADGTTDHALVRYMQEVVGYGVTGESNRPARYFLFVGSGSNGKSVFTGVLGNIFAPYTRRTAFATFAGDSGEASAGVLAARAGLAGARLVFTSETGIGEKFSSTFLKDYTGGDPVEAKVMRGNPFVYTPQGLVFTATNHRPKVDSIDDGTWRRLRLVYWRRRVTAEEMDLGLADRLLSTEAEGILAWAVRGAMTYYANGSEALQDEPECVRVATKRYREDSDVLHDFLSEHVEYTGHQHDRLFLDLLYRRYQGHQREGGASKLTTKRGFKPMIEERYGDIVRTAVPRHWKGYRLRPLDEVARLRVAGLLDVEPEDVQAVAAREQLRALYDIYPRDDFDFLRKYGTVRGKDDVAAAEARLSALLEAPDGVDEVAKEGVVA